MMRKWCRQPVPERAVGTDRIVVLTPSLDQHLRFLQSKGKLRLLKWKLFARPDQNYGTQPFR